MGKAQTAINIESYTLRGSRPFRPVPTQGVPRVDFQKDCMNKVTSAALKTAASALGAAALASASWAQAPVAGAAPPIKVALIESLSGPFANTSDMACWWTIVEF